MLCFKVQRICDICEVPLDSGRVRGIAFMRIGAEFIDYQDPAEWIYYIRRGDIYIVPSVRGLYEQTPVVVPGYGSVLELTIGYNNTLAISEPYNPQNVAFWNSMEKQKGFRVLFITELYIIDGREPVFISPINPVNGIDTINEFVADITWRSRELPRAYDKPPFIFDGCQTLEELEADYCPPCEPDCPPDGFGLFRFVVDGVTFPFTTSGQIIYVTAYGAACPIPLATATFNSWYYQPLIVGDSHFSLAQAINDYSIFLNLLAPGSYATLDGNVVSVYINRDGWRFSRSGFSNPDVCFANFGFCGFNDAGFDPPVFDIRVIQTMECCDTTCECPCGEPIYFDDPLNGTYISVLTGAGPYLMDVTNSVPYQTVTLDVGESVDLQAFLPGTPFDCCGPEDPYIFLEIGATTVPRNGTYTTPAGIKFELDETFLTITNNLAAPVGGSVNFLVRFSTCGASPILGLFTVNYTDDVYCPFDFGTITKTPAGALTSNGFGAFDYNSIFGGGNCGIGTLTFTRTGGAVPPCCTGGEAVSIDVFEDGVNIGTLMGAAGTVLTPTVLTPKAILFTLVSIGTGGFVVQAEQNVCGLPAVTGQWALTYSFVLCGETQGETIIFNSVPGPAVIPDPPCTDGSYSFEINVANLSAGLTITNVYAEAILGFDEVKVIVLEWDDEAQQTVSFHAINADIGSAPVCCNAYVAPTPESYAIYQPASTLGGEHPLNNAQVYPLDGYINNAVASTAPVNNNYFIPYTFVKTDAAPQDVLITLNRNNVAPASYAQEFHFYYDFCNQRKLLKVIVCNKTRMGQWAYNLFSATAQATFRKQNGNIRGVTQTRKLSGCCYNASLGGLACSGTTCVPAAGFTKFTLTGETGIVYPAQSITFNGNDVNTKSFPVSPDGKFSMQMSIPAGGAQFNGDIDFQWIYIENNSTLIANGTDITMVLTMERHDCGEVITRNYRLIIFPGFPAVPHPPIDGVPPN